MSVEWSPDVARKVRGAAQRGLRKAADELLNRSVPLVPVESGDLQQSGITSVEKLVAHVSYKTDRPIADIKQHEDLTYRHTTGQAKFLEQPLADSAEDLLKIVAAEMNQVIGE